MKRILPLIAFIVFISINQSYANPLKEVFEQATSAYGSRNYDEAIRLYNKAIEIYPNFAPTYNFLGLAHKDRGSEDSVVVGFFKKALVIDPNYVQAYDNLGKFYYGNGEFDLAEEYCLKAVELDPNYANAHLSLGWVYLLGKEEPMSAVFHFEQTLDRINIPYAYLGLGLAYFKNQEKFKALDMVTNLRSGGHEDLAKHLELMLREGRYIAPTIGGSQLTVPPKKASTLVGSDPSAIDREYGNMPVRLKKNTPKLSPKQPVKTYDYSTTQPTKSGAERIRELQQRQYKGSGY